MLPRVSCLIHTYKHAPFLARTIESVLNQDYPSELLEIIVIDDGSPDATPDVVAPYTDRLRYIRKTHEGQGSTANPGFAAATGDLVAGIDGDDMWLPHKIRRQVEIFAAQPNVGLVYGDMQVIDTEDRVLDTSYNTTHGLLKLRGRVFGMLLGGNAAGGSTTMIRRSLLGTFHPVPKDVPYPDWWTALRIAEVADVDYIDQPLNQYRYHGGNFVMYASGEKLARLQAGELAFRRWLLWEYFDADVQLDHLLRALFELESVASRAAHGLGCPVADLLGVSPSERADALDALEMMRAAWRAGAADVALRWLIRSLSRDPWNPQSRALLPDLTRVAQVAANDRALAGPRQSAADRRSVSVLAHLNELVNQPSLARAYTRAFSADDDVTLVVYAPDRTAEKAGELLIGAAPGLARDDAPDVELVAVPRGHEAAIAGDIDAVYSARTTANPFDRVERFDANRVASLHRFAASLARNRTRHAAV